MNHDSYITNNMIFLIGSREGEQRNIQLPFSVFIYLFFSPLDTIRKSISAREHLQHGRVKPTTTEFRIFVDFTTETDIRKRFLLYARRHGRLRHTTLYIDTRVLSILLYHHDGFTARCNVRKGHRPSSDDRIDPRLAA